LLLLLQISHGLLLLLLCHIFACWFWGHCMLECFSQATAQNFVRCG
jgi:hypothetical protein